MRELDFEGVPKNAEIDKKEWYLADVSLNRRDLSLLYPWLGRILLRITPLRDHLVSNSEFGQYRKVAARVSPAQAFLSARGPCIWVRHISLIHKNLTRL